ncbi:acetyl-CoA synthetase-like protein [Coniochaeta ligniaria NRRL 30616]|uniref:Acetyl-CoA synthetase-like protein n=1 Tax=Coniochaeta ligniaria NRRL 30616 TaxID=1408157 RepID=A0A1J7J4Z4_9PEZI|nr:acetyl-CoA synthetase-like protein [Coniochaeta ligniaria NRRL 30616]
MIRHDEDAGRRLLPHVIDELAQQEPERILYEFPTENDVTLPYTKVTARQYATAINRAAWALEGALGRGTGSPTVGYTGPQDLRYFIFVIAAVKAGYKMLYTSPRNSVEGDVAVITAADCKVWLVPSRGSNIQRLLDRGVSLKTVAVPDLKHLLDSSSCPPYRYEKTWESGRRDPVWVLHTSGSTGNPKPVFRFLDSVASIGANTLLPEINGRPLLLHDFFGTRVYLTFPFFHAAGLANGLLWPLFFGTTVIFGPERPVALDVMRTVIASAGPDAVFTAPSLVEEISKDPDFLILLDNVNAIAYGGGPVSKEAGSRIWKHTKLRLSIGTTETGWLPCVETDPGDWNYIHLHPNAGFQFQPRGTGLYELVAVRRPELQDWQPIFSTFPDLQEYHFKDLFSRHPTKPDLYTYEGRADNVIVLSNGEKVQPHAMELTIGANPLVDAVVVAGQGRFQTAAVVQLVDKSRSQDPVARDEISDRLWASVEESNKSAPAHARLHRDFIVIASPDKPFLKTSKGTVRRGPTIELYREELDKVYSQAELVNRISGFSVELDLSSEETLKRSLRKVLLAAGVAPVRDDDDDFFAIAGMDSLQVLTLTRLLARSFAGQDGGPPAIKPALTYNNSTLNLLAKALIRSVRQPVTGPEGVTAQPADVAQSLFEKYARTLAGPANVTRSARARHKAEGPVIILTGSTGSLGSYLLEQLLQQPGVREVWCLNRSADAHLRQAQLSLARGQTLDLGSGRVQFRRADLSQDRLGLDSVDYEYLAENVTHIIHTQWQVDFNLTLASFEPHIKGVRNLIGLAVDAADRGGSGARIVFTSSVGVANKIGPAVPRIVEAPMTDFAAAGSGYGESKLVVENLLLEAAARGGVDVVVCRVGQIAGPVGDEHRGGLWNRKEWLPSIIDASAYLGLVPGSLGRNEWVDWIPVDRLSSVIVELAGIESVDDEEKNSPRIFHCVNPSRVRWQDALLPVIRSRLEQGVSGGETVKTVELEEWVDALRIAAGEASRSDEARISAFKLVSFLSSLVQGHARPEFETIETSKHSKALTELQAVGEEWMNIWLDQWGY